MIKKSGNAFRIVPNKKGTNAFSSTEARFRTFQRRGRRGLHLAVSRLSAHCFCRKGSQSLGRSDSKGTMDSSQWKNGNRLRSCARYEVLDKIREIGADLAECAIKPVGWTPFWVMHLVDYLQQPEADDEEEEALYEEEVVVDPDRGEFTCPTCWLNSTGRTC